MLVVEVEVVDVEVPAGADCWSVWLVLRGDDEIVLLSCGSLGAVVSCVRDGLLDERVVILELWPDDRSCIPEPGDDIVELVWEGVAVGGVACRTLPVHQTPQP